MVQYIETPNNIIKVTPKSIMFLVNTKSYFRMKDTIKIPLEKTKKFALGKNSDHDFIKLINRPIVLHDYCFYLIGNIYIYRGDRGDAHFHVHGFASRTNNNYLDQYIYFEKTIQED